MPVAGTTRRAGPQSSSLGSSRRASGLPPDSAISLSVTSSAGASSRCLWTSARDASGLEPRQRQLWKAVGWERGRGVVSGCEHHDHAVRTDPAGAEQERARPWPGRASGRRRRRTARGSPRPRRSASSRSRRPPGTARPRDRPPRRTRRAALGPAGPAAPRAAASPGAAAGAEPRTARVPRPRAPGSAARSPLRSRSRARRAGPTCPRPAPRAPPRCRPTRVAPARRERPEMPAPAHGPPARVDRTGATTSRAGSEPGALTGATPAERGER